MSGAKPRATSRSPLRNDLPNVGASGSSPSNPDPLRALPKNLAIPRDEAGPLFAEPWEARAFAVVVDMSARGLFTWKEFQQLLVAAIRDSEGRGECRPYYLSWLCAAERLLEAKGLASDAEIDREVERLRPDDRTIRFRG